MRKGMAILLSIMLVCSLLVGCSSCEKDKEEAAKGRYMERSVKLPELEEGGEIEGTGYDSEGRLHVLVQEGKFSDAKDFSYVEKNGDFEKTEITDYKKLYKEGYCLYACYYGDDGKWYVYLEKNFYTDKKGKKYIDDDFVKGKRKYTADEYNEIAEKTKDMKSYLQDRLFSDGKDITPASWKVGENDFTGLNQNAHDSIDDFQVNKDGIVVYFNLTKRQFMKYDPSTKKESIITKAGDDTTWHLKGNSLYVADSSNSGDGAKGKVTIYDINTLQKEKINMEIAVGDESQASLAVDEKNNIYISNKQGVYRYQKNGTLWEQLFQTEQFSIGSITERLIQTLINKDGEINVLTIFDDTKECKLYDYYYDANVVSKPTKKIVVYSLWESGTIREAARQYQLKHPDTSIEFTVPDQSDTDKTDIIQKLNTEILAGKGADIIITDGLNQNSYEKKGVLEDLSSVIDSSKLIDCITKNYTHDGKLYGVPVKITVPFVASTADMSKALASMENLAAFCNSAKKPVFVEEQKPELLQKLLFAYGDGIFKEDGTMDSSKLSSFLEQTKTIMDHSVTQKYYESMNVYADSCQADAVYKGVMTTYAYVKSGAIEGEAAIVNNSSVKNTCEFETARKKLDCYTSTFNNTFMSSGVVTINANSKQKEDAKEFVKYLFSDEIQEKDCRDGYPVTKTALEQWKSSYKARIGMISGFEPGGKDVFYMVDTPSEETRTMAYDMIQQLGHPTYRDTQIISMITEESKSYLDGSSDLKTTVDTIIQKVDRYLEEQK